MMKRNKEIGNSFNRKAARYENAAKVQREIGSRLFERLDLLKVSPRYILDLGCGTGFFTAMLRKKYPRARIIGLDLASNMLAEAQKKQALWRKFSLVQGNMAALPFPDGLFDIIFANQVVHWTDSLSNLMSEIHRVLNPAGCLMFSTLGPDTFAELKTAWSAADGHAHANHFMDMHDVGDCMLRQNFLDPVVDMERLHVHYQDLASLLTSLKDQGVRNIHSERNPGLTGRQAWQNFSQAWQPLITSDGKYPLSYEIIYGHAFKGSPKRVKTQAETYIPVSSLRSQSVKES